MRLRTAWDGQTRSRVVCAESLLRSQGTVQAEEASDACEVEVIAKACSHGLS